MFKYKLNKIVANINSQQNLQFLQNIIQYKTKYFILLKFKIFR